MVADLKNSHPRQWYSKLKRMSSYETNKNEKVTVEKIADVSD